MSGLGAGAGSGSETGTTEAGISGFSNSCSLFSVDSSFSVDAELFDFSSKGRVP